MIEAMACGTPVVGWRRGSGQVPRRGDWFIVDTVDEAVRSASMRRSRRCQSPPGAIPQAAWRATISRSTARGVARSIQPTTPYLVDNAATGRLWGAAIPDQAGATSQLDDVVPR
jgi:hypothetical protein